MELDAIRELFEQVTILETGAKINLEGKVSLVAEVVGKGELWSITGQYSLQRSDEKGYEISSKVQPRAHLSFVLENKWRPVPESGEDLRTIHTIKAYVSVLESVPQINQDDLRPGQTSIRIYLSM